jgi:hypothetical protein
MPAEREMANSGAEVICGVPRSETSANPTAILNAIESNARSTVLFRRLYPAFPQRQASSIVMHERESGSSGRRNVRHMFVKIYNQKPTIHSPNDHTRGKGVLRLIVMGYFLDAARVLIDVAYTAVGGEQRL